MIGTFARGLAAGAAGSTVLNAVSSLDRALRGRPASSTPGRLVEAVAKRTGRDLPGTGPRMPDRQAALLEDGVALALAALACLPGRNRVPLVAVPR